MTTTHRSTARPSPRERTRTPTARPQLAPLGRRRRWGLASVSLIITIGSALAFVVLWMEAGDRRPVLALANPVDAGEVLDDTDLLVVGVAADPGVKVIPGDQRDRVVGRTAAVPLAEGALLTEAQLGSPIRLDPAEAVLTISFDRGDIPLLQPGDTVQLVALASRASDSASDLGDARVLRTDQREGFERSLSVSLVVPRARLVDIQAAAGAGRIRLALVSP